MPAVGDQRTIVHTFSTDEVRAFSEASGDKGRQHVTEDAHGRLMVHGLLLGTLPTIVGGEMSFLARQMEFEFLKPVFTGEEVRCHVRLTQWEPEAGRVQVRAEWECEGPTGVMVMRGHAMGIVRLRSSAEEGVSVPGGSGVEAPR